MSVDPLTGRKWYATEMERSDYEPLECDECHKVICMVHEMDLNGSYFCCFDCWNLGKVLKGRL
jgi:hypothetical protein